MEWNVSPIEWSFENIKYGSSLKNADFNNLLIEYKQMLFTKQPIDNLTDNSVERLKVNTIKLSLDSLMYEISPRNAEFDDLFFVGDGRLMARWWLYCINDNILFCLING